MSEEVEYRCFIGGLSWSTSDRALKDAFEKFGKLLEAKVTILLLFLCAYYFFFFGSFFGLSEFYFSCYCLHVCFNLNLVSFYCLIYLPLELVSAAFMVEKTA